MNIKSPDKTPASTSNFEQKIAEQQREITSLKRKLAQFQSTTDEIPELDESDALDLLAIASRFRDSVTGSHTRRIGRYAGVLAIALGWSESDAEMLEKAAPLHDTGKLGIPDNILRSTEKLTDAQWKIMRRHPKMGYDILSKGKSPLFALAAEIALNHHECWDGSGYPSGKRGSDIPESARITIIVDVFDALSTKRPYKEAWAIADAFDYIEEQSGLMFDPSMVAIFRSIRPQITELWHQLNEKVID